MTTVTIKSSTMVNPVYGVLTSLLSINVTPEKINSPCAPMISLLKPRAFMLLSQLGKGEVPSKTGVVVVDNRSYGTLNLILYRLDALYGRFCVA